MHRFPQVLLHKAKESDIPIRLSDFVSSKSEFWAVLSGEPPPCLLADLENEGLTIESDKSGEWFICKLSS